MVRFSVCARCLVCFVRSRMMCVSLTCFWQLLSHKARVVIDTPAGLIEDD